MYKSIIITRLISLTTFKDQAVNIFKTTGVVYVLLSLFNTQINASGFIFELPLHNSAFSFLLKTAVSNCHI